MKSLLLVSIFISSLSSVCWSEPMPEELFKKLSSVIEEHCPDATINTTNSAFTAKHDTMIFTFHRAARDGHFSPKTHQEEGPNYRGFHLAVTVEKENYKGPLKIPQELNGPYFPTCFNVSVTPDGKDYYWIRFSYGNKLDPDLKQAIYAALPGKTRPMRFNEVRE